jgi:hypothetical protein
MKSKLHFGGRVAVLNIFLYQTGGSMLVNVYYSSFIRSRLVQQHGHQSTTLTSLFYKIFIKKLYMYYIFMKVIFKTNLFI